MSDSDSSDGIGYSVLHSFGNNINSPEVHHDPPESPDIVQINFLDDNYSSSSSDSDASLVDDSEESNNEDGSSSSSSERSLLLSVPSNSNLNIIKNTRKRNTRWSITRELYNREIGNYNSRDNWGHKFYQTELALKKLKISKQLKGHSASVNSLNFNKTGVLITSGSNDSNICLWDWSKGKRLIKHDGAHSTIVFQTKFLTTDSDIRIVSSADDGLVTLSAVNHCEVIFSKIIARHQRSCYKIGVHHELPYIVLSCGEDGVVKNIDVRESTIINHNETHKNILHIKNTNGGFMPLFGIDVNPMNPYEFIINGGDEYIRMYDKRKLSLEPIKKFWRIPTYSPAQYTEYIESADDIRDPRLITTSMNQFDHVTSAVYDHSGTEILASYFGDDIYLFDVNDSPNCYKRHYCGHLNKVPYKNVSFCGPRSDFVASGSDCGNFFIWNKNSGAIVQTKHADKKKSVSSLEGHPHLPILATCGIDKTIKIWEPLNKCQDPKLPKINLKFKHSEFNQTFSRLF